MTTKSPVIVALDYADELSTLSMVDQLDPTKCRLKVGKELFTYCGPDIVRKLVDKQFDVFLDLKFHDIPNTVAGAVKAAADLGVWMVNVHASGGLKMMEAAKAAIAGHEKPPLLIAVTILTSMERADMALIGLDIDPIEQVQRLAVLTQQAGLDGVVCSAQETKVLRASLGDDFLLVTPGIRPADAAVGDQKRIATPVSAIESGSSYLVIGRPITQSSDPLASLNAINASLGIS